MKLIITLIALALLWQNYKEKKVICSSTVWIVCYWLIFVLYPVYGLKKPVSNSDMIDFYAVLGILFFGIGVLISKATKINIGEMLKKQYRFPVFNISAVAFFVVSFFAIVAFVSLYGASSIQEILAGSITSKMIKADFRGETAGIGQILLQIMMPCALATWMTADTKKQKNVGIISLILFIIVQLLFNFTRIFLITYLVTILFYELRNKSRYKQLLVLFGGCVAMIVLMVAMNFFRTFGFGERLNSGRAFDLSYIFESTDFGGSYYWFDRLLSYGYPEVIPIAWFKPFFAFIPRSVWPSKPDKISHEILLKIDPALAETGYTTAGNSVLGEGYAILGVLGIVLFPLVWGYICEIFDRRHFCRLKMGQTNSVAEISYYLFSIFIVLCIQRGDWSQYMIVYIYWWIVPLLLLSRKPMYNKLMKKR